ncbi:MAG: alpha/beta hydrolase [Sandaracinaceae bacterium]|nr:MAG: alpha/beta hydrolase [Sandaracinaceae bacterium]
MRRWICVCALLGACGGGGGEGDAALDAPAVVDAAGPRDWPAAEVPAVTEPEPGIRREVLTLEGHPAPPNPSTGDATPDALDRVQVVRYSGMDEPDVRAVVVAMPGIFGGAGSFDPLARNMVRRSLADAPIEVWVIDRRSNLLEDLRGLDAAEASGDADIARGYYFGGETVGGERFEGFRSQEDVPYMSEWGLETHLEDLRRVIERVPAERVFLMGHSLGASMTEAFAAWRFGSVRGAELVAGLILVDGAAGTSPLTETEYREGTSGGFMAVPGVDAIRSSTRYLALPLLGVEVYPRAEIAAMDALWAPDEVRVDRGRAMVLSTLMSIPVGRLPPMTNAGAFGFAFDDQSNGLSFAAVGMGRPTGGPVEPYESLFGSTLERPSDSNATYDWIDARDVDPPELTPLANLAHSWIDGRTNFAEWYFPVRLTLDLAAVGGLAVDPDGWQAEAGLRAFDGALVDAPILAVAAALAPAERYEAVRARAAPVGDGRPNAGATRDEASAFSVVDASAQTHIDPLSAADVPENPVPGAVLEFVYGNAAGGRVPLVP